MCTPGCIHYLICPLFDGLKGPLSLSDELLVKDMEEPGPESVLLVEIHKYEIRRKKPFIFAKKII